MRYKFQLLSLSAAFGLMLAGGEFAFAEEKPGYLLIKYAETEVKYDGKTKKLDIEVKTQKHIPMDGKSGAFGYAALTDNGNNLLVLVTHLPIDDSSHENPKSGFHAHVLDLKAPTAACEGANFEVDLENSGKNAAFDAKYAWSVKNNQLSVKNVPVTDLGDAGVESVVSFTLKPILGADEKPTNLCVTVADQK
ncbi:MAG: hypothetical protein ACU833_09505 [Gammaproteobacteria bacterium]